MPEIEEKIYDILDSFFQKWIPIHYSHLSDTDENDGQKLREDLQKLFEKELQAELKKRTEEIFTYFDKYACIKNDAWYLELKKKFLGGERMKIETMKLIPNKENNGYLGVEITALKSIEFETMDYPEFKIEDLSLNTCNDKNCRKEDCDLWLNIRVSVTRDELFSLLGALKNSSELWREEDLPCKIKIEVNKKENMDYWGEK